MEFRRVLSFRSSTRNEIRLLWLRTPSARYRARARKSFFERQKLRHLARKSQSFCVIKKPNDLLFAPLMGICITSGLRRPRKKRGGNSCTARIAHLTRSAKPEGPVLHIFRVSPDRQPTVTAVQRSPCISLSVRIFQKYSRARVRKVYDRIQLVVWLYVSSDDVPTVVFALANVTNKVDRTDQAKYSGKAVYGRTCRFRDDFSSGRENVTRPSL